MGTHHLGWAWWEFQEDLLRLGDPKKEEKSLEFVHCFVEKKEDLSDRHSPHSFLETRKSRLSAVGKRKHNSEIFRTWFRSKPNVWIGTEQDMTIGFHRLLWNYKHLSRTCWVWVKREGKSFWLTELALGPGQGPLPPGPLRNRQRRDVRKKEGKEYRKEC